MRHLRSHTTRELLVDRFRQDLSFALRGFRRTPGFFATAITILALGIGMSVAMFSVFRVVLVHPLPVVDQNRLAVMWTYREPTIDLSFGTTQLAVVRRESRTMRDIAAVAHWPASPSPVVDGDRALALNLGMVTGNFFDVLGAHAALGRLFHSSDDDVGAYNAEGTNASKTLVLSYRAWREKFGGDSSIIGRRLYQPWYHWTYTVIGVAPRGLDYPSGVEFWVPMIGGWAGNTESFAVARLAPGATLAAARNEYFAIENRLSPSAHLRGAHAATFADTVLGDVTPVLGVLSAAVALLLLIACLNVGNMLLLRASGRAREIAVRRALGAGYGDIVRQLLVEAMALAAVGGALGYAVAAALLRALPALAPPTLPRLDEIRLSGHPAVLAIIVSSVAVLCFGLVPALFTARANLASPLRADSRSGAETRRRRAVRQTLVASQVALATIMLGGAALLAKSLERLERQDTGYVSDHLSILFYSWDTQRYDSLAKMVAMADRLQQSVAAVPGVSAATPIVVPPLVGKGIWQIRVDKDGQADADAMSNPIVSAEFPGPGFFRTFGIPILRGRAFTADDRSTAPLVAIVSESFAKLYWPGQDPIGKRVRMAHATPDNLLGGNGWRTVVGVVHDTHLRAMREGSPTIYMPADQGYWQGYFAIRSSVSLSGLMPALRAAGHAADPQTELWHAATMDQLLAKPLAEPRLGALLMSGFGFVALFLAAIGLYGVMSSLVRDRTREIGIRIALGASAARVRHGILRDAAIVTVSGLGAGLFVALIGSRLLTSLLFDVSPTDPVALGGACVALLGVGALAAYIPARRATHIDPVQALRAD